MDDGAPGPALLAEIDLCVTWAAASRRRLRRILELDVGAAERQGRP